MSKNIIITCVIFSGLCGGAVHAADAGHENYFVEGATWIYETTTSSYPTFPGAVTKLWLEAEQEIDGHMAMPMWEVQIAADKEIDDGQVHSPEISAYIRTEGSKVYFLTDDANAEWELLYDFDIEPGGKVSFAGCQWPYQEERYFNATCVDVKPMENTPELTLIKLKDDDDHTECEESIVWISGVGNIGGPLCNWFNPIYTVGSGRSLLEMSVGDRIIYRKPGYSGVNGLSDSSADAVRVAKGEISVAPPAKMSVFDISGKKYCHSSRKISQLSAGCYIVVVNGKQRKVRVP